MSQLNIKKLETETYTKLRIRAKLHGISVEEEAKQILKQVTSKPVKLGDLALETFGEYNGINLEVIQKTPHYPIPFTK